jgi:hypothetical protein
MNLVAVATGVRATATANVQDAVRLSASVAVQETSLDPTGNCDPDSGEQVTDTGACPSDADGVS